MPDYRTMFDKEHLGAWDLQGRDVTVTIAAVKAGAVGGHQGKKKDKKPIISFEKTEKTFACNVTNAKTIAGMYGNEVAKWIGKRITLYATQTSFGGAQVDCIRIRPQVPNGKSRGVESQPVDQEMRSRQDAAAGRVDPETGEVPPDEEPGGERDGEP